jgi:hypothetical protein
MTVSSFMRAGVGIVLSLEHPAHTLCAALAPKL